MATNKKSLGEHLEQGLTNLADRGYQIQHENHKYEEESILLGLISDQEKLRILKADLYRKVRDEEDVEALIDAIHVLEESIQRKFQRDNCSEAVISRIFISLFVVAITSVTLSFPISWVCGGSQSPFCRSSRVLTEWVAGEFREPQPVRIEPLER